MADNNFRSIWGENAPLISGVAFSPPNPTQFSDVLKFSLCTGATVIDCHIEGGGEDCVDINRGERYSILDSTLAPNGKNGITIKGAVNGALIQGVTFQRHGRECDIELGQFDMWWKPGRVKTRNVKIIDVAAQDGKPVIVKVWDAEKPAVARGNVKLINVNPILVKLYFLFRWLQLKVSKK